MRAMEQPGRNIDLSDDTRVIQQIKYAVDSMRGLVERRESEIKAAQDEHQILLARKQYLQERLQSLGETSTSIVAESIPRVYTKIGAFLSERQHTISGLNEEIEALTSERESVQRRLLPFGKRERLEELDKQIKSAERKLNTENKRQEEEMPVLSQPTEGLSEDDALAWMRQVMLIIPDVKDEVRLCNNMREDYQKLTEEREGIDVLIEAASNKAEEKKESRYSEEVKKAILYLYAEIDKYSMLKTFQLVFDQATAPFRETHKINNIQGKYHRYDLYARLLFAMRYYGKALGTAKFSYFAA